MIKRATKNKTVVKKAGKKAVKKGKAKGKVKGKKSSKKEFSPAEVRKEIAELVGLNAVDMVEAVIEEGMKGQLAPTKYMLEVAHIYPQVNDGSEVTREEDCLAKTLLDRLNIPDKPVGRDEEEDFVTIPPRRVELETESEPEPEKPGQESADEKEEEVTVVG